MKSTHSVPQIECADKLLSISDVVINQVNGLFSLNDLHKASGGEPKHKPTNFMRNAEVQELIVEIEQVSNLRLEQKSVAYETIHGGKKNGTFVCRELVYRYAMWISPKFSLMVIRAFDAMNTGAIPCLPRLSADDTLPLRNAVKMATTVLRLDYSTIYTMIHHRFGVNEIKSLSREQIGQAIEYVHHLMIAQPPLKANYLKDCASHLKDYANLLKSLRDFPLLDEQIARHRHDNIARTYNQLIKLL